MRSLGLLVLFVSVSVAAPVPDEPVRPTGPAPTFATIMTAAIDKNTITVQYTTSVNVTKNVPMVVVVGGNTVTQFKTVTESVLQTRQAVYTLDRYDFVTGEGKTLSTEAALPLLKGTAVLLISEGPLDPAFQKLLAKDALLLVRKK